MANIDAIKLPMGHTTARGCPGRKLPRGTAQCVVTNSYAAAQQLGCLMMTIINMLYLTNGVRTPETQRPCYKHLYLIIDLNGTSSLT